MAILKFYRSFSEVVIILIFELSLKVDMFITRTVAHFTASIDIVMMEYLFLNTVTFSLEICILVISMDLDRDHKCMIIILKLILVILTYTRYVTTSGMFIYWWIQLATPSISTLIRFGIQRRWHLCKAWFQPFNIWTLGIGLKNIHLLFVEKRHRPK